MKCPKCHREVEEGSLYCRHCLAEVPWVKEFDSVETQIEKKKMEEADSRRLPLPSGDAAIRWVKRKRRTLALCGAALFLLAAVLGYSGSNTFSALYQRAQEAFQEKDYEEALHLVQRALERDSEDLEGNLLLGRIMEASKDQDSALMVYWGMTRQYPGSTEAYGELLRLLVETGRTGEVKEIMDSCGDPGVREAMKDYICPEPRFSLEEGTYTSRQTLELTADYARIYYTLDGEEPGEDSPLYQGPLILSEGTTVVKAMGVNEKNIRSDVVTGEFVVVSGRPDPPGVTPESGDYDKKTRIELEVPDGCRAYYAFDEVPTQRSTEYTMPISMPVGYHEFYAISVSANGEVSEPEVRLYYLEY